MGARAFLAIARYELAGLLEDEREGRRLTALAQAGAEQVGVHLPVR
jgi:hypothetical protein